MKIIVVGCGRLGAEVASRASLKGHEVSVIDVSKDAFNQLPPDFVGLTFDGDAMSRDVLSRSGIQRAGGVAVVTGSDVLNAVVGHVARDVYKVPSVVVRNVNPVLRYLYDVFKLQVVSASSWGAQRMEEMLYHADVKTVFSAGNGEVEVYEFTVPVAWNGHSLSEYFNATTTCRVVAHTRAGRASLPEANLILKTGDVLHVSSTLEGVEGLRKCAGSFGGGC